MRLQLITALAAALAVTAAAASRVHADADPDAIASARIAVYADSDATSVTTSSIAVSGNVSEHLRVNAQYLVDAVSSASVDVVSSATGQIHDLRHEVTTGAAVGNSDGSVAASYTLSTENDWTSHTVRLALAHDFLQHDLTLGLEPQLAINRIGRRGGVPWHDTMTTLGAELYATYTASPRDLVSIGYGLTDHEGYQASPYRFVVYDHLRAVRESVPRTRWHQTVTVRWNHHLFEDSALRTQLRGYRDSWDVTSITAFAEYVVGFGALDLGVHLRGYAQRAARFYRPIYNTQPTYMTADRELSSFVDGFGGVTLSYARPLAGLDVRYELTGDGFAFQFSNFPALATRTGLVVAFGVAVSL